MLTAEVLKGKEAVDANFLSGTSIYVKKIANNAPNAATTKALVTIAYQR